MPKICFGEVLERVANQVSFQQWSVFCSIPAQIKIKVHCNYKRRKDENKENMHTTFVMDNSNITFQITGSPEQEKKKKLFELFSQLPTIIWASPQGSVLACRGGHS